MNIPQFKNTEHALSWGRSHYTPEAMQALESERAHLTDQFKILLAEGKDSEALFLASGQAQFVREALEEARRVSVEKPSVFSNILKHVCLLLGFIGDACLFIFNALCNIYGFFIMALCAGIGFIAFFMASIFAVGVIVVMVGILLG